MIKFYLQSIRVFLVCALVMLLCKAANAQTTISTPLSGNYLYNSTTADGAIVFGIRNTNATDITITNIGNYVPAGFVGTLTLWRHQTAVTGAPTAINTTNGWISTATAAVNNTTDGLINVFSNVNLVIPAGVTYRFAVSGPPSSPFYSGAGTTLNTYAAGGVEILTNANVLSPGYGGAFPGPPANTPRCFQGSVTFKVNASGVANNASAFAIVTPVNFCAGSQEIKGKVLNNGNNIINNVKVNWEVDGVLQPQVTWTTPIDIAGSTGGNEALVTLGNVTFGNAAKNIRVWTSLPNGAADPISADDQVQQLVRSKMSGTYTIGGATPDFATFAEATAALSVGVCGPVTINVATGTGPYTEQVSIPLITGVSATNRVTFNGNGNTLQFTPVTAARHVLKLENADYVTIKNFEIRGLATDFGYGIHLAYGSDRDSIVNCTIDMSAVTSTTAAASACIVASNSTTAVSTAGNNANYLTIKDNIIKGAYQGVILYGNADGTGAVGNKVLNNTITDFYANGMELSGNDGSLVEGNDISRMNRATVGAFEGIELSAGNKNVVVNANKIHDTHNAATSQTGTAYGIFISACDAVAGSENKVTNNLIYNFNSSSTGAQYGLGNTGSDGVFYYHNTVVLDGPGTTGVARGFYQTTLASNIKLVNNIFRISRAGAGLKYCLYFNTTTSSIVSNNNVLYSTGGIGSLGTAGSATIADWKAVNAGAYDQQSVSADPLFNNAGTGDYTPFEAGINNIGANIGVATDIKGAARTIASPDPGAYEFSIAGLDASISWVSPVMPTTAGLKTVTVNISNAQTTPITAINISYTDGTVTQSQTFTGLNIAASATQPLSFTTQYNLSASTRMRAYITSVNGITDNSQVNDTTSLQIFCLPLAGNYTINNAAPTAGLNFTSFTDAVNQLVCSGVGGPVTFTVAQGSGPYTEQITIPAITGASSARRITFKGNQNVLQFAPVTANRHVIKLDGADHIVIDSLNVTTTATDFGWGIHLLNGADSNIIKHCIVDISANTNTTESNSGGIVFSGSTTSAVTAGNANYNVLDSNTIKGAYKGIALYGSTTSTGAVKNRITNNTIQDFYASGMELVGNDSTLVSGNDISRPTKSAVTTFAGVEVGANSKKVRITANRIHDTHNAATVQTGAAYGVFLNACDAAVGTENIITNNLIYNFNATTTGLQYGLYNSGSDGAYYYHNTIVLDGPGTTGTARGFYQTTLATNIKVMNNLISISRAGTGLKYCLYFNTTTSTIVSNNNVLYNTSTAGGIGSFSTTGFTTLADWKTANGNAYDQASVSVDPLFVNAPSFDFTPSAPTVNDIGANVGVATDILGNARSTTPDPGAYEFGLGGCTNPVIPGNATASETVACSASGFTLDLIGNSSGAGQTYQWQSSPDNSAWTDIGSVQSTAPYTATQSITTYYRCVVKCSAGTPANSTSILVTSYPLASGTFTINNTIPASSTNFQTFGAAVSRIKCGINGPIVLNVLASGSFNEQVILPAIPGTSATNTITINGNGALLSYLSTSGNERAVIKLNGTDYVKIDSLNIEATGSSALEYGYGIHLVDNADHNTITRCNITTTSTPFTAASTAFAGIVINASAAGTPVATGNSLCDSNMVYRNNIVGGYTGVAVTANGITNVVKGNDIIDNTVSNFYIYGITVNGNQNAIISGNDISRASRSSISTFYGIDVNGAVGLVITKNKIHDSHTGLPTSTTGAYGVYHSVSDATAANPNIVSNNMVYNFNNVGSQYGFYNLGCDTVRYYYNSILLDNATATTSTTYDTKGFYQSTAATGIEFKNNIIVISRNCLGENHCLYFNTPASIISADYNDLYMAASAGTFNNIGYYNATQYTSLAAWQAAAGTPDVHSRNEDPSFISSSDLHLQASSPLDDKGIAVAGVTDDIDGEIRSAGTSDIGADELPPAVGIDMKPELLVSPSTGNGCYNNETITVRIKNNSTSTINFALNPVTVTVGITGAATASYTATVSTGTLASAATIDVTMSTPAATLDMSAIGSYNFAIGTAVTGDVNASNNSLSAVHERLALTAGAAVTSKDTYCVIGGTPTLSATGTAGYSSIRWQQSTTPGIGFTDMPSATTNPYTFPTAISQTKYYRLVATCGMQESNSNEVTVTFNNPTVLSTTPRTRCGTGTVGLSATASAGASLYWYANSTGGSSIGMGSPFITPSISSTTTYYVAAGDGGSSQTANHGVPNVTTGTQNSGLLFNLNVDATLNSIDVYTNGTAGTVTLTLQNSSGTLLYTSPTFNVISGTLTTPQTLTLDWAIPVGTGYRILVATHAPNLGYHSGVFPIDLGNGVGTVTSGATATSTTTLNYFIYNMRTSTGCSSARVPVVATVDNTPGCSVVPITLLNFKGEKQGAINKLEWTTSTEINSAGFALERSADGMNFSQLVYVASKAVNGNSNSQLIYSFNDVKPLLGNGYYRLKQMDRDGKYSYSSIMLLKGNKPTALTISSIYPNPSVRELNLVLLSPMADDVRIVVTDITGKVLMQKAVAVAQGDNKVQLNVQSLSQGTYIVKAVCGNGCESAVHRFVKQ